jgi:hypothetical protein
MAIIPVEALHAASPPGMVSEKKSRQWHQRKERSDMDDITTTSTSSRRIFGHQLFGACTGTLLLPQFLSPATRQQAQAAGLLEEFGTDPTKIAPSSSQQKSTSSSSAAAAAASVQRGVGGIDPTLRASYYYPTAKKRYLPRIQKVTVEMPGIYQAIQTGDWQAVETFTTTTAENAILPLQLYVSSLDGQGLSLKNSYAKQMKLYALEYERLYKVLRRAVQLKDASTALQAISDMALAVADYRQTGRLDGLDDNYGNNIPSVDEIKRMSMRKPTLAPGSFASPTR